MVRYTLLRSVVFFGVLLVLWLVGLRGRDNLIPLVIGAAVISMVISYFALRRYREAYSREIADRLEARAARNQRRHTDEVDEDAEVDGAQAPDGENPTYR